MSEDYSSGIEPPKTERPVFLDVNPGMTVIVKKLPELFSAVKDEKDWWMGEVIYCDGGARDPAVINQCQVADVDSGVIRWVNADLIIARFTN